jgi:hypothetical protein
MTTRPLVSCVSPTRDRPFLAAQAVRCFLRPGMTSEGRQAIAAGIAPWRSVAEGTRRAKLACSRGRAGL